MPSPGSIPSSGFSQVFATAEPGDPPLRTRDDPSLLSGITSPHHIEKELSQLKEILHSFGPLQVNMKEIFKEIAKGQFKIHLEIPLFADQYQKGIQVFENTVASIDLLLWPEQATGKSKISLRLKLNRPIELKKYGLTVKVYGLGWQSGQKIWADSELFIGGRVARDVTSMVTEMFFGQAMQVLNLDLDTLYEMLPQLKEKIGAGNKEKYTFEEKSFFGCSSQQVSRRRLNHMAELDKVLYSVSMNWQTDLSKALGIPLVLQHQENPILLDGYGLEPGQDAFMRFGLQGIKSPHQFVAHDLEFQVRLDFAPFKTSYSAGAANLWVNLDYLKIGSLEVLGSNKPEKETPSYIKGLVLKDIQLAVFSEMGAIQDSQLKSAAGSFSLKEMSAVQDVLLENLQGKFQLEHEGEESDLTLTQLAWEMPRLIGQSNQAQIDLDNLTVEDAYFHIRRAAQSLKFDFYLTPSVFINLFNFSSSTSMIDGLADCERIAGEGDLKSQLDLSLLACDLEVADLIQEIPQGEIDLKQFESQFVLASVHIDNQKFNFDLIDGDLQFATTLFSPILTQLNMMGHIGDLTVSGNSLGDAQLHVKDFVMGPSLKTSLDSGKVEYYGVGGFSSLDLFRFAGSKLISGKIKEPFLDGKGHAHLGKTSVEFDGMLAFEKGVFEYLQNDKLSFLFHAGSLAGSFSGKQGRKKIGLQGEMRFEKTYFDQSDYGQSLDVKKLLGFGKVKLRLPGQAFNFSTRGTRGLVSLGEISLSQNPSGKIDASLKEILIRGASYYSGMGIRAALSTHVRMKEGKVSQWKKALRFQSQNGLRIRVGGTLKRKVLPDRTARIKISHGSFLNLFSLNFNPQVLKSKLAFSFKGEGSPNHFFGRDNAILILDEKGSDRNFKFHAHKPKGRVRLNNKSYLGQFKLDMEAK